MKSQLMYAALSLLATAVTHGQSTGASTPSGPQGGDQNQQMALLVEVRKLRTELLELRMEAQAAKIPALEQGLSQIDTQRARIAEEERTGPQRLASLDTQFQGKTLPPEQRAELEGVKATFLATQAERANTERASLQAREAELSAALNLERERLQALKTRLNQLVAAP